MAGGSYVLETVFPSIGVVTSTMLYLAPLPAVVRVRDQRQLGGLNTLPIGLMLLATVSWVAYGLAVPNGYIVASNVPGLVASVWYVTTVLPAMTHDPALASLRALLVGGTAVLTCVLTWVRFGVPDELERAGILGGFATLVCIVLFASPLSTIAEVVRVRSSASVYGPLTAAQVFNCGLWLGFGSAIGDLWVWGPNLAGFVLGLAQLALKLRYPSAGVHGGRAPPVGVARGSHSEEQLAILGNVESEEVGGRARTKVRPRESAAPAVALTDVRRVPRGGALDAGWGRRCRRGMPMRPAPCVSCPDAPSLIPALRLTTCVHVPMPTRRLIVCGTMSMTAGRRTGVTRHDAQLLGAPES